MTNHSQIPFSLHRSARWFISIQAGTDLDSIGETGQRVVDSVYDAANKFLDFYEVEIGSYHESNYERFIDERTKWRSGDLEVTTEQVTGSDAKSSQCVSHSLRSASPNEFGVLAWWKTVDAATKIRLENQDHWITESSEEFVLWKGDRYYDTQATEDPISLKIRFIPAESAFGGTNEYRITVISNTDIWFWSEHDQLNYERFIEFLQTLATGDDVTYVGAASDVYSEDRLLSII